MLIKITKKENDYESESGLIVASVWSRRASFGADRETVARFEQEDCGVERRCNFLPQPMQNRNGIFRELRVKYKALARVNWLCRELAPP